MKTRSLNLFRTAERFVPPPKTRKPIYTNVDRLPFEGENMQAVKHAVRVIALQSRAQKLAMSEHAAKLKKAAAPKPQTASALLSDLVDIDARAAEIEAQKAAVAAEPKPNE